MSKFKLTQTATEVQGILNNSLQKPTGLTKTKLVGVGVNGQENIEIGDNLTLANGKLSSATGSLPSTIKFDAEGNREAKKNLKIDGKLQFSSLVNDYNKEGNAYLNDRNFYLPAGFKGEYGLYSCTSLSTISGNGWVDFKYIYLDSQGASNLREVRMARVMPLHYGKITGTNTLIYSTFYFDSGSLGSSSDLTTFMRNKYNQIQANGHIGDNVVIGLSYEQGKVMALTQAGTSIDLPNGWTYSENQYGRV